MKQTKTQTQNKEEATGNKARGTGRTRRMAHVQNVGHDGDGATAWRGEVAAVDVGDAMNQCLHVGDVVPLDGDLGHFCKARVCECVRESKTERVRERADQSLTIVSQKFHTRL